MNENETLKTVPSVVNNSEIVPIRELLRKQKYLLSPKDQSEQTSVNNKTVLSECLRNFTAEDELRRRSYFQYFINNENQDSNVIPVSKTESVQKASIQNETIVEIQSEIFRKLEELPDGRLHEEMFYKTVKGKTKAAHIEFYNSISEDV